MRSGVGAGVSTGAAGTYACTDRGGGGGWWQDVHIFTQTLSQICTVHWKSVSAASVLSRCTFCETLDAVLPLS